MPYTRTKPVTFQLEGTFLRKLQAVQGTGKTGKPYTQNKFILHTLDGHDVYISKFGELSSDFIGKDVRFEATKYNDTNFTVVGEIEEAGDLVGALPTPAPVAQTTTATAEVPSTRRRGRPAKTETPVASTAPATTAVVKDKVPELSGREAFRGLAEESVIGNLQSAITVVGALGLKGYSVTDLVAVADLLGRTTTAILMDSQKRSR